MQKLDASTYFSPFRSLSSKGPQPSSISLKIMYENASYFYLKPMNTAKHLSKQQIYNTPLSTFYGTPLPILFHTQSNTRCIARQTLLPIFFSGYKPTSSKCRHRGEYYRLKQESRYFYILTTRTAIEGVFLFSSFR